MVSCLTALDWNVASYDMTGIVPFVNGPIVAGDTQEALLATILHAREQCVRGTVLVVTRDRASRNALWQLAIDWAALAILGGPADGRTCCGLYVWTSCQTANSANAKLSCLRTSRRRFAGKDRRRFASALLNPKRTRLGCYAQTLPGRWTNRSGCAMPWLRAIC